MKTDRRKLRAIGLLLAIGFVSGLFVQYKAPGFYFSASRKAENKQQRQAAEPVPLPQGEAEKAALLVAPRPQGQAVAEATAANAQPVNILATNVQANTVQIIERKAPETPVATLPETPVATLDDESPPPGEATPPVLRRYQALAAIIGNTLEITGANGEKRYAYFAPRGVAADFDGEKVDARFWTRDDDHLCRGLGADKRECFYLAVQLDDKLRKGSVKSLDERIHRLEEGASVGAVRGFEAGKVRLLRGNIRNFPDYIPLLEGKPGPEWTRDPSAQSPSFVGAILLRHSGDEDRAATFFAPNGQVFEVSRVTRQTVSLRVGSWRRQGDLVCRALTPVEADQPGAQEECAHASIIDGRIEFAEAGPARRSYLRWPWADEETAAERASRAEATAKASEVTLAPAPTRSRKLDNASQTSFKDLR